MLREFILLRCSYCTTSAIRLMAQSSREASVGGRSLTSSTYSSSVWHCITCSGDNESRTLVGSSLDHAWNRKTERKNQRLMYKFSKQNVLVHILHTLISPAKQWTSIRSGIIPRFSCSLTASSSLFSAVSLKIPSAWKKRNWRSDLHGKLIRCSL